MIVVPQASEPIVSIIICASTKIDLILDCLQSLMLSGPQNLPFETIVVLNEPEQNAEAQLRASVSGVQIIVSPVNLGLAGGSNVGREQARGRYIVLLHDDAIIEPGWLENLVETAIKYPMAGAVGALVLNLVSRFQSAGMILWSNGITTAIPEDVPADFDNDGQLRIVDYCGTSSLLISAAVWDRIGGLDERFYPAYYVDTDVCMAIRQRGLLVLCQLRSKIRHHGSASSSVPARRFFSDRNRALFVEKWSADLRNQEPYQSDDRLGSIERAIQRLRTSSRSSRYEDVIAQPHQKTETYQNKIASYFVRKQNFDKAFQAHLMIEIENLENINQGCHELQDGEIRRFSHRSVGNKYIAAGELYKGEHWGAWMKTKDIRLIIPLADNLTHRTRELQLAVGVVHKLDADRTRSPIQMNINGRKLVDFIEVRPGPHVYRLRFPAAFCSESKCLSIEIRTRDPGLAVDNPNDPGRWLAVGLRNFRVDAIQSNGENNVMNASQPGS